MVYYFFVCRLLCLVFPLVMWIVWVALFCGRCPKAEKRHWEACRGEKWRGLYKICTFVNNSFQDRAIRTATRVSFFFRDFPNPPRRALPCRWSTYHIICKDSAFSSFYARLSISAKFFTRVLSISAKFFTADVSCRRHSSLSPDRSSVEFMQYTIYIIYYI